MCASKRRGSPSDRRQVRWTITRKPVNAASDRVERQVAKRHRPLPSKSPTACVTHTCLPNCWFGNVVRSWKMTYVCPLPGFQAWARWCLYPGAKPGAAVVMPVFLYVFVCVSVSVSASEFDGHSRERSLS